MQPDKRISRSQKSMSSKDTSEKSSHCLLYFDTTDSHNIVHRNSINNITGNHAFLNVHGKKTMATIVAYGTFEFCENEQRKLTRESQGVSHDSNQMDYSHYDNDDEEENDKGSSSNDEEEENSSNIFSFLNHETLSHGKRQDSSQLDNENLDLYTADRNVDEPDVPYHRSLSSNVISDMQQQQKIMRKRKKSFASGKKNKRQRTSDINNEITRQTTVTSQPTITIENDPLVPVARLDEMENRVLIQQNQITKALTRLEKKFDFHLNATIVQGTRILDPYRATNETVFPTTFMHGDRDLLRTIAKDIFDFCRKTLRILYTSSELKSHILPPERSHLKSPALDEIRFDKFLNAVRIKFRLDENLMQECFNHLLRTKLSNFLYEERRRESRKIIRDKSRLLTKKMFPQRPCDAEERYSNDLTISI